MRTGKRIRSALFLLAAFIVTEAAAQQQFAFRVTFTDKNGTSGDIHNPPGLLSSRALLRRSRQSIAIDSADLPVSRSYTDSVLRMTNGVLHLRSRWLNECVVLVTDSTTIGQVRSRPFVRSVAYIAVYASPLHLLRQQQDKPGEEPAKLKAPAGSLYKTTNAAYYGDAYDQISLANGQYLHEKGFRGKGKIIAVLDAGFRNVDVIAGFDSLRRQGRITDTYNFTLDTSHVYASSDHGTQVLSTMAGIVKNVYAGTAPDATYALYITEDNASEQPIEMDNLVAAMERADSIGADVINISLGYNSFLIGTFNASLDFSELDGRSTIAARGANSASAKGLLVVASAGNEGNNSWKKILTPGDADSALTIGSVNFARTHSVTSGNGPNASGQIKPDVCMLGDPSIVLNGAGASTSTSGTSLSTPELAGLAACLWQAVPTASPSLLRDAIRKSAHIADHPDNLLGYGVPDFKQAFDKLYIPGPVDTGGAWSVYPNPFTDQISLSLHSETNTTLEWRLSDITGRSIYSGSAALNTGNNGFSLTVPGLLPHGVYILQLQSSRQRQVIKLQH
jgi:serine protease AprX